ncbi:MFS transporter, partial [Arthrobacter rhombi]|uniref:MFS transporter n=1 Tax=Arthrobacter rhombi TaxID=71253 RepID=UPI003FD0E289
MKTLLPLAAVSLLGAGALEVGIINALGMAAFLLIGVPAGTWVDRMNKRRVMIAADLIRCLAVLGVPIAYALGSLELWQILLVATVLGFADVFYSTASSTVLPRIVEAPQISEATARILTLDTTLG